MHGRAFVGGGSWLAVVVISEEGLVGFLILGSGPGLGFGWW